MTEKELERQIKNLESIDTSKVSIEEIKELLKPIFKDFFFPLPKIQNDSFLYRTVKLPLDKKPEFFKEIIYPPKEIVNYHQRANRPGNPVFYCSTSKQAAVYEGRYKVDDTVTLSEWEVKENTFLLPVHVGFYSNFLTGWDNKFHNPKFEDYSMFQRNEEEIRKMKLIHSYLAKLFCQIFTEDHKYKLSIAIAESVGFNSESNGEIKKIGHEQYVGKSAVDALLFPSILMKGNSDNLAIRRYSFHKKVRLVSIDFCQIKELSESGVKYEELDFANSLDKNQKIQWKGRKGKIIIPPNSGLVSISHISSNTFEVKRSDGNKIYRT